MDVVLEMKILRLELEAWFKPSRTERACLRLALTTVAGV